VSAKITEFPAITGDGTENLAHCTFATLRDLDEIARWERQSKGARDSETVDALEFAALASKRWRFYHDRGLTVASVSAMER